VTTAPNQFEIAGPVFKPATQYLTSQGYPLGTTCWFFEVRINFCCEIICGDTIDSAWAAVVAHLHAEGGLPNVNVPLRTQPLRPSEPRPETACECQKCHGSRIYKTMNEIKTHDTEPK
jgi:hypothetical protein